MADERKWVPPQTIEELYAATKGNKFAGLNAPTAGPRDETKLERGEAAFQLYSAPTPNGWKVSILLEELGIPYDAHIINMDGDQFSAGFVGATPNSKIPAAIDYAGPDGKPIALMESAAIMWYLCEKHAEKGFLPTNPRLRYECLQWMFWQMAGQGPMTGNFGHFMVYAPPHEIGARNYGVARYGMEVQRLCDVLERHLAGYGDFQGDSSMRKEGPRTYLVGDKYTVADMACYCWATTLRRKGYDGPGQPRAQDFLGFAKYKNLNAWLDRLDTREAVKRGIRVCAKHPKPWLVPGDRMYKPETKSKL